MSDDALLKLARAAGLHASWTDANGRPQEVKPDTLRAVLNALGYPAVNAKQIADSQRRIDQESRLLPPLVTARGGEPVHVGVAKTAKLEIQGEWRELKLLPLKTGGMSFRAPDAVGYHGFEIDGERHTLAVAPPRCFGIADVAPSKKLAGIAVQLYALRGGHSEGFGDFAALGEFAARAAEFGIDAVAVSPVHARFAADPSHISPYSPSTRLFVDPLYADVALAGIEPPKPSASPDLIDWSSAHRTKFAQLRAAFDTFRRDANNGDDFRAFCARGGDALRAHAIYEALDDQFRKQGLISPHKWPAEFHDAKSAAASDFAKRHQPEIEYRFFLQWLAERSLAAAQARAKENMAIGLIADLAVGVDPSGSEAWSETGPLLSQLHIGAPPDAFNPDGQDWGLTTFSPMALRASGYSGFLAMLRTAMRHAGGIRIDHAMGLRRLWVLPQGASPADGVYLTYPLTDLIRLISIESRLHKAIVIGEDLGTVPQGFRAQIAGAGILGMRVLWFERDGDGRFLPPERWDAQAIALTTTHDLPTVAGWWRERDIDWAVKLRRKMHLGSESAERRARKKDRALLWSAWNLTGCAKGAEPKPAQTDAVIDAALCDVSRTPCPLAIAAVEDILGEAEQPNLPGTTDEHPNWRRRLPAEDFWSDAKVRARLSRLAARRKR
ncbi:MAG TPA: 4-alpha-glucanotransferase [Rhizomicrobium sp.]|jgi:4-alpha-glucanotransferase